MIEIFAYAIGVMYTPGPVNLLGLNTGLNGHAKASTGYYFGVGSAMLLLFLSFGWLGSRLIGSDVLIIISILGCGYIATLAVKIFRASVTLGEDRTNERPLRYRQGLVLQLLNPKGVVATLPIATIQFPGAGIHGAGILVWSLALTVLAIGAPGSYAVVGHLLGKRIENPLFFTWFNRVMAALLFYVAGSIGYEFVYMPLLD
ncbi:MAG TPA: LysE family transporter [Marinobacter sp.]|uniref:LysE family translocator n=1 Tax=Marinobacter sp. TaxID=50741 RepID=UPI0026127548|nr:LysE family transporter [Marinobacter sp.]HET8800699.1 LysE family transporter [Marinobacter sp.]